MVSKPYWSIPITENGDPLRPIPGDRFILADPHPYACLGAPYGPVTPYSLRSEVLAALEDAQTALQQQYPQWQLYIFDAYRPVAVQQFMVDHTFQAAQQQYPNANPTEQWEAVYQLWAPPNLDPNRPPPHSTGGAIDLSLWDLEQHTQVDMGSPIDELSPRSAPDYFQAIAADQQQDFETRQTAAIVHHHRTILDDVMRQAGFKRHPGEWWHFCLGEQMWGWLSSLEQPDETWTARYGRADLVSTH